MSFEIGRVVRIHDSTLSKRWLWSVTRGGGPTAQECCKEPPGSTSVWRLCCAMFCDLHDWLTPCDLLNFILILRFCAQISLVNSIRATAVREFYSLILLFFTFILTFELSVTTGIDITFPITVTFSYDSPIIKDDFLRRASLIFDEGSKKSHRTLPGCKEKSIYLSTILHD